jgi:hypothetical protein
VGLPFPYNSIAGAINDPTEIEANKLYQNYMWVARLADEMDREAAVDLKRVVLTERHCAEFARLYELLHNHDTHGHEAGAAALDVIEGTFASKKCVWPSRAAMEAELDQLHDAAIQLGDFLRAAHPEAWTKGYATLVVTGPDTYTDIPIKAGKSNELAARVAAFRSLFGPRGAQPGA